MSNLNQCQFIGRVGQAPTVRYTASGDSVCLFSIAVNESWRDKNSGEKVESTEWVRIVTYRKLAEICSEYLNSGSLIWIQGKLKNRKWQDTETGQDRYITEIVGDQMRMLGGRRDGNMQPNPAPSTSASGPNYYAQAKAGKAPQPETAPDFDDIPF